VRVPSGNAGVLEVVKVANRTGCASWAAHAAVVAVLLAANGCATSGALGRGRTAEQKGDYHQAYAIYAAATRQSPSNRALARAMARVAPQTVQYWNRAGGAFESQGDVDRAWRCYMRALLVNPGDPTALAGIERIGEQHPDTAEAARVAWMRHGERSLQVGRVPTLSRADAAGNADSPAELGPDTRPFPTPAEVEEAERSRPPGCVAEATVSRKDRRHRPRAFLYDGLSVEVRDTDRRPRADLNVYLGERRMLKARNLKPGEDAGVTGRSGSRYAVRVLSVEHATETVRVGLFSVTDPPR